MIIENIVKLESIGYGRLVKKSVSKRIKIQSEDKNLIQKEKLGKTMMGSTQIL